MTYNLYQIKRKLNLFKLKATLFVVVNGRGTQILQIEVNYNFLKIDYDQFYSHRRQQQKINGKPCKLHGKWKTKSNFNTTKGLNF